MKLVLSAN